MIDTLLIELPIRSRAFARYRPKVPMYARHSLRLSSPGHWVTAVLIAVIASACHPIRGGLTPRPLDCMCVIHADAWALNAISRNNKVFMAPRNVPTRQGNFGDFHLAAGPIGNAGVAIRNTDGLPSVY